MKSACKIISLVLLCVFWHGECVVDENQPWLNATATFYGGSQVFMKVIWAMHERRGACGYGSAVDSPPWAGRSTAVSNDLFQNGGGCGACYQIKCVEEGVCSESGAVVVAVDQCPGCDGDHFFDLFQSALSSMVTDPTKVLQLITKGQFQVLYKRVPCEYPEKELSFEVKAGSNSYWFEVTVMYVAEDGEVSGVEIQQSSSQEWMKMSRGSGANWVASQSSTLQPPFSLRVTLPSGETLTAQNVIPSQWQPDVLYTATFNSPLRA